MPINWSECCICQLRIKESLRSTAQGHEALAKILPLFAELNELGFDISRLDTTGLTLQESLEQNHAVCHHSSRTNQFMLSLSRFNSENLICLEAHSIFHFWVDFI